MNIEIKKSIKPIKYENAIYLLEKRLKEIHLKKNKELIWILEHKKVFTGGASYKDSEIIDKSIMYFAINEMIRGDLDRPIVIDESLRLSKKFSSPESYKFINASLDKYLKTHK